MTDPRLESLLQSCPDLRLKTEAGDLEHYGRDWTRRWAPAPLAIALPGSVEEVQAVVRWANAHKVAVVPSGGRTGLSGGAVAANGELVLSLERMHKLLAFDAVDRTLTVQAGIPLQKVQETAREHGLHGVEAVQADLVGGAGPGHQPAFFRVQKVALRIPSASGSKVGSLPSFLCCS